MVYIIIVYMSFHCVFVSVCACACDRQSETEMVGPIRPQFVLFGSSIVELSYSNEGWGAILADIFARKVFLQLLSLFLILGQSLFILADLRYQFIQNNKKEENKEYIYV